jgi:hypothetical protein
MSGLINLLSLIFPSRNVAKVHFRNDEEEIKAVEILFEGGYVVDCYADDVYGLTSQEQLRALDESGVPYERIE